MQLLTSGSKHSQVTTLFPVFALAWCSEGQSRVTWRVSSTTKKLESQARKWSLREDPALERSLDPLALANQPAWLWSENLQITIPFPVFALARCNEGQSDDLARSQLPVQRCQEAGKLGEEVEPEGGPGAWRKFRPITSCQPERALEPALVVAWPPSQGQERVRLQQRMLLCNGRRVRALTLKKQLTARQRNSKAARHSERCARGSKRSSVGPNDHPPAASASGRWQVVALSTGSAHFQSAS